MNLLGSKTIETERLMLKASTMKEQKKLWEILMIPEVNKYYLTINKKYKENLKNWEKQEKIYQEKVNKALEKDRFEWSIFLKETGECIGQINAHTSKKENYDMENDEIKSLGWFINPKHQGNGYATEAAIAMIDYLFNEVEIKEIRTSAAICNPPSWKLMEKLGLIRDLNKTYFNQYTFIDEDIECYFYGITKEQYLNFNKKNIRKR